MDIYKMRKIVAALNRKNVSQPCPRCASKNFSVVGESEISIVRPPLPPAIDAPITISSIAPIKTTMPTVVVSCDNCGYIAQHAQAALDLLAPLPSIKGIGEL